MSRGHRLPGGGGVFHWTHRCHNRAFLLKFACDRDAYRVKLRQRLQEHKLWLLDYCLTSNHVHLLVDAEDRAEIGTWMQRVAGEFARAYNRRQGRSNAFWGDNDHATLVEEGDYLWRCLCYMELNMTRAGVVSHACASDSASCSLPVHPQLRDGCLQETSLPRLLYFGHDPPEDDGANNTTAPKKALDQDYRPASFGNTTDQVAFGSDETQQVRGSADGFRKNQRGNSG